MAGGERHGWWRQTWLVETDMAGGDRHGWWRQTGLARELQHLWLDLAIFTSCLPLPGMVGHGIVEHSVFITDAFLGLLQQTLIYLIGTALALIRI